MGDIIDDGSLACLNIKTATAGSFECPQVKAEFYVDKTFWVHDFVDNVTTPKGDGRMVYMCSFKEKYEDEKIECFKIITTSKAVKEILKAVKEMGKLPRKVTLKRRGMSYTLE